MVQRSAGGAAAAGGGVPKELELLKGVSGFAVPGNLMALMGGSGAGEGLWHLAVLALQLAREHAVHRGIQAMYEGLRIELATARWCSAMVGSGPVGVISHDLVDRNISLGVQQ
jgi:ABC-type microcin C transport system duplicated ATPase subunit YejF